MCSDDIGTQCNGPKPGDNPESCDNEIDDDCDGLVDEDCPFTEPDGGTPVTCKGTNCQCNPLMAGDPVNMAQGTSFARVVDVEIPGSTGTLQFARRYSSNPLEWVHDGPLAGAPKPFGASLAQPHSVQWWHEYLSVVVMSGNRWSVRDREGRLLRFYACSGVPCQAEPGFGNKSIRERLQRTATGFVLVTAEGERLVFEAPFAPASGDVDRYFLSRIISQQGVTTATLSYRQPADMLCPAGAAGSGSGVPYLAEVASPEARFLFDYRTLQNASGQVECVISSVSLQSSSVDAGSAVPVVTYTYTLDGSVERPGRLASAVWGSRSESYEYTGGVYQQSGSDGLLMRHEYGGTGEVALAQGGGESWQFNPAVTVGTCQSGSNCCGRSVTVRQAQNLYAGRGDGTDGGVVLTRTFETLPHFYQQLEPRLYRMTDTCPPSTPGCSPGTVQYEWTCTTATSPGHELARKDKRGNWEAYTYAEDGGVVTTPLERIAVKRGATDKNGANALEQDFSSYTYGPNGEQLLSAEERDTVLGASGQRARTAYLYEPGTTRRKATILSGWTRVRHSNGTWSVERRFIGTFFFTAREASGESAPDPLGRTLEVHGPCFVSDESATDCQSTEYPLTQYHYWPETETSHRRSRLKSVSTYASPTATPNVTTFNQYDAWGNVTESVDANGVITQSTYHEQRLVSQTVGSQAPTHYGYDQRRMSWIQLPEGNYEVFCYRKDTPSSACAGGTLADKLQWRAKSSTSDGATWTEKVTYAYWPDDTVMEERYLSWGASGAETRRVVKYAADAHRRPTWQQRGEKPVGSTSWSNATVRLFDGADNLVAVGAPYNLPPALCGGINASGTATSPFCDKLMYDRADRLAQVDSAVGARSCMSYDVQGNVTSVKAGCLTNTSCTSCTQPAAQYTHDDFGRVVEVQLPHAAGPIRYAYDASGNLVIKETEKMRQDGEFLAYTYDSMGRMLSATRVYAQLSAGQQTLYRFGYDLDEAPDASCPQPSNTRGRTRYRVDSFGRTWFQYDEQGRVTGEIRVRAGTTLCNGSLQDNPHTLYAYTANGNLSQITYPHGRIVTYVYGTGAAADRVDSIDVTLHDGTAWQTERILSHAAWEPYAGLRGYQLHHLGSTMLSAVEYALGDDATTVPSSCSAQGPLAATSDLSGRLRSLRISSGTFTPGTYPGNLYQRTYQWRGDQVLSDRTCVLGATSLRTEQYNYDRAPQLISYTPNGSGEIRNYAYDKRGNRTGYTVGAASHSHVYASAPYVDLLLRRTSNSQAGLVEEFTYDADGRVTEKRMNKLSSEPTPRIWLSFAYGPDESVATDSVFKAVTVNGVSYSYFYDALGRRRLKVYPSGVKDEFFYDTGHQLLTDQGVNTAMTPIGFHVEDDYVWLDGRPVALIRGRLSTSWERESDGSASCERNGEAAACGVYFLVTDHIGKPVVMLDASRRITGIAEYDAFGHVNRYVQHSGTAHPYAHNLNGSSIATLAPSGGASFPNTVVQLRALFGLVDTESNGGVPVDYVRLKSGTTFLTEPLGGRLSGQVWTPWVQPASGTASVQFTSNGTNCCPDGSGGLDCNTATCPQAPNYAYYGVVLAGYEYRRFQAGAQPFWTPLRFPGQYHDTESDLFENWNRYYDPSVGRYLQPEPLASKAPMMAAEAIYGYAGNNPAGSTDPDGLFRRETLNMCYGYFAALEIAKQKAGCGSGNDCGAARDERCQRSLRGCDICSILAEGSGPLIDWDEISDDDGSHEGVVPDDAVHVNPKYCHPGASLARFASAILHEAMHACQARGYGERRNECQAYQTGEACFGESFPREAGFCFPIP